MNCLTGETKWPEFIKEHFDGVNEPFTAGLELWPDCNFRCIHCYAQSDREAISESMTTEQILNVLDLLCEHNCIEIFLTGGEVLLHKDFFEIYKYAKRKGLMVSVLTNGSLISQQHTDLWLEYPPELVSVTMYGASPKTYAAVTGNAKGYEMFCRGVELLSKNKIPFEIKCIGMKQNLHDIQAIRHFARGYGLRNAILAWDIRPMNDGNQEPLNYRVSPSEAFEQELKDEERRGFWNQLACDPLRESKTVRQAEGRLYPCSIAQQFVFITHDGYMQGCVKALKPRYHLLSGSFDEGWKFLQECFYYKKASKDFPCLECPKFRYCSQCSASFQDENGDPEQPVSFFCELAELEKNYMDQIARKS